MSILQIFLYYDRLYSRTLQGRTDGTHSKIRMGIGSVQCK